MDDLSAFDPVPGLPEPVAEGIRRILAPNPSPFTYRGTNSYLLGEGEVAVVDPGPLDPAHLEAILAALAPGERISHILVTHAHLDHSPLARPLAERCGAPVLAHGTATAGRSAVMEALASAGAMGGGEGVDEGFRPDECLADGERVSAPSWQVEALWTPGHFSNHLCFDAGGRIFSGDLVMGWSTSLVSPPDGDLTQFMASCRALRLRPASLFLPGHGDLVRDPAARLDALIAHREGREREILAALREAPGTARDLAGRIYRDLAPGLLPAATRNVLAHLVDLTERSLARPEGPLRAEAVFGSL